MAIYFLRHGECEANLNGTYAGQRDNSPLTPRGREQALKAAADFAHIRVDVIISSPLDRALDTAKIVAKKLHSLTPIQTDVRLLERDMGEVSGKKKELAPKSSWIGIPGLESAAHLQARVLSFFREHATDDANLLIVSHAGVGVMLEASRQGLPAERFYEIPSYPNGKVIRLDLEWLIASKAYGNYMNHGLTYT